LARYLERFYHGRRIWLVYGAMRDKAIDEVAGVLFPMAAELVLTAPDTSRALRPEALAEFAGRGHIKPTVESAIAYARAAAADDDVIVITGSLFVVGEARRLFLASTGGRWQ
jgi:dihydrofolate synthase/folylpolyglutamate synthase